MVGRLGVDSGLDLAGCPLWNAPTFKVSGFTIVAILSLALGIGANTAIFTLINDLLLKSLPVRAPEQFVSFGKADGGGILGGLSPGPVDIFTYDFYQSMQKATRQKDDHFQGICAFGSFPVMVSVRSGSAGGGPATQAISHLVSGTFFSVLGADPVLGRTIGPGYGGLRAQSRGRHQSPVLAAGLGC